MTGHEFLEKMEAEFVLLEMKSPAKTMLSFAPEVAPVEVEIMLQPLGQASLEVLLSVVPPKQPEEGLQHTPCDIVLVIDVSGSMNADAELPDQAVNDQKESSGLSILDLVKHAARTILENLNESDRLAVVTFSNNATLIQGLVPMTQLEKSKTWQRVEDLTVEGSTNLWSGIREGLNVFENHDRFGSVQQMFVLTDGVPNHMCPSQGYVRKLHPMMQKMRRDVGDAPSISCFGFGYHLRSALLRSIAEVGRGHYAFIPDAGMIGTVFIHAVANLFSTFATNTEVILSCSNAKVQFDLPAWLESDTEPQATGTRMLNLGNIRYGQSRDIIVKLNGASRKDIMKATVRCSVPKQAMKTATTTCDFHNGRTISKTVLDYHISRHEVCAYLTSLSTKNQNNEHVSLSASSLSPKSHAIDALVENIQSRLTSTMDQGADTADLTALLADLQPPDPANPHGSGQIALAVQLDTPSPSSSPSLSNVSQPYSHIVQKPSNYERWGIHYLPSMLHAHMRQTCLTFKDPGPLRYGINSPLFVKMRDELDAAFDRLPAPKGSLRRGEHRHTPVKMSRYNSCSNPCFAGHCQVKMGDGISIRKVEELRVGDRVSTARGAGVIKEVLMTPTDSARSDPQDLYHVKDGREGNGEDRPGLWITPYHPIYNASTARWVFPKDVGIRNRTMESDAVYSILLEVDEQVDAHTIEVGGILCATLGHGLTRSQPAMDAKMGSDASTSSASVSEAPELDVRAHPFFGSYAKVLSSLSRLRRDRHGRRVSGGVVRQVRYPGDSGGIACGFARSREPDSPSEEQAANGHSHLASLRRKTRTRL